MMSLSPSSGGHVPSRGKRSARLSDVAWNRPRAPPGPGTGRSTPTHASFSGPPGSVATMALVSGTSHLVYLFSDVHRISLMCRDADVRLQRPVHRAAICDFDQPLPLRFVKIALNFDLPFEMIEFLALLPTIIAIRHVDT